MDGGGAVTTSYTYGPFGQATSAGPSSANPFQFTGRENDGTGLYYYRARYYSPPLARFLSEDPIGLLGGLNLYGYVGANPLTFSDPTGLVTFSVGSRVAIGGFGFVYGGGASLNVGYSRETGFSISITGTHALHASSQPSGILPNLASGLQFDVSNASGVSRLPGLFLEVNRNLGRTGLGYFTSPDRSVEGGSLSIGLSTKQLLEKVLRERPPEWPGVSAGVSDTSAVVQYERRVISLGARGDDALFRIGASEVEAVLGLVDKSGGPLALGGRK
jgi:RHS repeat-associated protein